MKFKAVGSKSLPAGELPEMMAGHGPAGFEYAKPSELSGGMPESALRTPPCRTFLLLDEPFSAAPGLPDPAVRVRRHRSIIRQTHKTAILVTHDLPEAISAWLTAY